MSGIPNLASSRGSLLGRWDAGACGLRLAVFRCVDDIVVMLALVEPCCHQMPCLLAGVGFFFPSVFFLMCAQNRCFDSLRLSSPPAVILYVTFNPTSLWANSGGCWEKALHWGNATGAFRCFSDQSHVYRGRNLHKKRLRCFLKVLSSIPTDQFQLKLHRQSVTTFAWWHKPLKSSPRLLFCGV